MISCRKQKHLPACTTAVITSNAQPCQQWGITVNGQTWPSKDIPEQFHVNGLQVCTTYALYEDPALCPCCGGTFARIIAMQ